MYEEKQLRLWLMVIPFWVVHIFGAHTLFIQDSFVNVVKESVSVEYSPSTELEELVYTEFINLINSDKINDLRKTLHCCLNRDSNMSEFMKEINTKNRDFDSEPILCDSSYDYCSCSDEDLSLYS